MKITALFYASNQCGVIEDWAFHPDRQSLTVRLASLGAVDCIATVLNGLADRALLLWPHWYGGDLFFDSLSEYIDDRPHPFFAALEISRRNRGIEFSWLKKAAALAAAGKPPLASGVVGEIQARQLALSLTDCVDNIIVIVPRELREAHGAEGFAHAVEWLARESGFDVTILLPEEMAAREDLSSLLYNATRWAIKCRNDIPSAKSVPPPEEEPSFLFPPGIPEEDAPDAERLIGAPHPRSRGEQLLAERLAHDPQLSGLFGHNQPVNTSHGDSFLVDLLWPEGKIIVEVDGYFFHSNKIAFAADRDRDYRLLVSGYRVLRLTHDEVVRDVDLAVEKIRDMVHFIHNQKTR